MEEDDYPIIRYIPMIGEFKWPLEARTLEEAFAIMRQPGRWLTRAELDLIYPAKTSK